MLGPIATHRVREPLSRLADSAPEARLELGNGGLIMRVHRVRFHIETSWAFRFAVLASDAAVVVVGDRIY